MTASSPVLVALAVFVVYVAFVGVLWQVNHVRYDQLAGSRETVVRGIVVPIAQRRR